MQHPGGLELEPNQLGMIQSALNTLSQFLSPPPISKPYIAKVPPEIWAHIFSFACVDDGRTGRAIALVSSSFFSICRPYIYQSLEIHDSWNLCMLHGMLLEKDGFTSLSATWRQIAERRNVSRGTPRGRRSDVEHRINGGDDVDSAGKDERIKTKPTLEEPLPPLIFRTRHLYISTPNTYTQDSSDSEDDNIIDHGHFGLEGDIVVPLRDIIFWTKDYLETFSFHCWFFRPTFWFPLDWDLGTEAWYDGGRRKKGIQGQGSEDDSEDHTRPQENEEETENSIDNLLPRLHTLTISGLYSSHNTSSLRSKSCNRIYPNLTKLSILHHENGSARTPPHILNDIRRKFPYLKELELPFPTPSAGERDFKSWLMNSFIGEESGLIDGIVAALKDGGDTDAMHFNSQLESVRLGVIMPHPQEQLLSLADLDEGYSLEETYEMMGVLGKRLKSIDKKFSFRWLGNKPYESGYSADPC